MIRILMQSLKIWNIVEVIIKFSLVLRHNLRVLFVLLNHHLVFVLVFLIFTHLRHLSDFFHLLVLACLPLLFICGFLLHFEFFEFRILVQQDLSLLQSHSPCFNQRNVSLRTGNGQLPGRRRPLH